MLHRFRDRFGTAGLAIAIVALVAALAGTAVAASGALTGRQKKEVKKIAKKYAGKPGAPGAAGPAGPAGLPGAAGAKGESGTNGTDGTDGEDGTDGTNGTDGENGKSVEAFPIPTEQPQCNKQGGVAYEVEESGEPTEVCNGADGQPWTAGGTLPEGSTETGMWVIEKEANEFARTAISFPIPLATTVGIEIHFINVDGEKESFGAPVGPKPAACPGTAASPAALPGNVCVYEAGRTGAPGSGEGVGFFLATGPETAGSVLAFSLEPGSNANGTFAVTAPES